MKRICYLTSKELFRQDGWGPFHLAAREGDVDILKRLLMCEGSSKVPKLMDIKSNNGRTPMHTACLHGRIDAVKFLLNEAKDRTILENEDSCGAIPLMEAVRGGHLALVDHLASLDRNLLYEKDSMSRDCLHTAAHCGHIDIIDFLVTKQRMSVNGSIESSLSPLHWAAKEGHAEAVRKLLDLNASTQRPDSHQRIPLALAIGGQHVQAAAVLMEHDFQEPFDVKLANAARSEPMKDLLCQFFKRKGLVLCLP